MEEEIRVELAAADMVAPVEPELLMPAHGESSDEAPERPLEKKNTVYEKIARWIVAATVFLIPLFFLPWTTGIIELNKLALLTAATGAALIFWFLHVIVSGQMSFRRSPVNLGILAVLGAEILAVIFSLARFKGLFGLTNSLSDSLVAVINLAVFYFLVINLFRRGRRLQLILAASLGLALLYGLLQMSGFYIFKYLNISILDFTSSHAFNTVGSVNALGLLAAAALPLFGKIRNEKIVLKFLRIAGLVVAFAVLLILNWWILWAAAIAGMTVIMLLDSLVTGRENKFKISRFLLPMTVIVLGIFFTIVNLNLSFIKKNFPVEIGPSFGLSGRVVKSTLSESPIFGYGPENFSLAFDKFGADKLVNTTLSGIKFFDSTSEVINFAAHGGIILLAAFAFLFWSLFAAIKRSVAGGIKSVGLVASLAALVVGSFLYPLNLTMFFLFFILAALLVLDLAKEDAKLTDIEEKPLASLAASLGFVGSLILVLVETYFGATVYLADAKYADALSEKDSQKRTDLLVRAVNLNGHDDRYYRSASQAALELLAQELIKKADKNDTDRSSRIQNYIGSAINLARRATEVSPRETNNWTNLGGVYQELVGLVDGVDNLAAVAYAKASELRPGDANIYNQAGNVFLGKADLLLRLAVANAGSAQQFRQGAADALTRAEENYKRAIELSTNFGVAIYNLGVVYDRQGKLGEAVKQLEKIMPFNGNQPNLAFELGLLYYRNGQKDKAFAQLQRAVILSPNFSNARWYLALIYEERRDLPNAIEQLEKILSLEENKGNQIVTTKLSELKKGQTKIPPQKVLDQKPLQ